jgi:hypothetical protein
LSNPCAVIRIGVDYDYEYEYEYEYDYEQEHEKKHEQCGALKSPPVFSWFFES